MLRFCNGCEKFFTYDADFSDGWCHKCAREQIDMEPGMEYIKKLDREVEFYIDWYFDSTTTFVSPELLEVCKTIFKNGGDKALEAIREYIGDDIWAWTEYLSEVIK